jgi:hypothetical protein
MANGDGDADPLVCANDGMVNPRSTPADMTVADSQFGNMTASAK